MEENFYFIPFRHLKHGIFFRNFAAKRRNGIKKKNVKNLEKSKFFDE